MLKRSFLSSFILLFILSLAASILFLACTASWGLGAGSDSTIYIAGARNILNGQGYRSYGSMHQITEWPPFFSFSLAVIGLFGPDPLDGARILHGILFGINILMAGMILKKITHSTAIALAGAWFMFTSNAILTIHSMAMSEPWFIFLSFTGLFVLIQYFGTGRKRFLFSAGALTALACLDRYAGIALIATGMTVIFLFHPKNFLIRTKASMIYFALSFIPLSLWLLRNYLVDLNAVGRHFLFYFPSSKYFHTALDTVSFSILPAHFPAPWRYTALSAAIMIGILMAILIIWKAARNQMMKAFVTEDSFRWIVSMAIFTASSAGFLLILRMFMDPSNYINPRHFSPLFVAGLLGSLVLLDQFLKLYSNHAFFKKIAAFLLILLGFFHLQSATQKLIQLYRGDDICISSCYTRRLGKTSATVAKIKELPQDTLLYSNIPMIIYLNANRNTFDLPKKNKKKRKSPDKTFTEFNEKYPLQVERITKKLVRRNGYIVYFGRPWGRDQDAEEDLRQSFPLILVNRLADGAIYKVDPAQELKTAKANLLS